MLFKIRFLFIYLFIYNKKRVGSGQKMDRGRYGSGQNGSDMWIGSKWVGYPGWSELPGKPDR